MKKTECPKCGKKVKDLNSHSRYCDAQKDAPHEAPQTAQPSETPSISIAPQAEEMLQKEEQPLAQAAQPAQPQQNTDEMYKAVADSVHQTMANIVKLVTKGAVEVPKENVDRLNTCAVLLLKKYDTNGKLLEYSPEIAYVLTLADIGTQVYVEFRKINKKEKPVQNQPKPPELTTTPKDEVKAFNKLVEQI